MNTATDKQQHYIECLAIDLGFGRRYRNLVISELIERDVKFLDELTVHEASIVINRFKAMKEEKQ